MLDIAPEFAQEAEAIMIRKAVERGRFEDARTLAKRSRMRSIHYRQFIEDRLFQVRRAADRVTWSEEVLPELDRARAHLKERRKHEATIINSIREHIAHAKGDTRDHLVELKNTIDDCHQRHAALFQRVMNASEEFRQLQVSAFRARLMRDVPDLEERILAPLLAAPMSATAGMSDEIGIVFAAPAPPRMYDLALVFANVTQPRFRRDPAGAEDVHDLVALKRVPPEFDADDVREAQDWLVRMIAARTRLDMASAIREAEDQRMTESTLRCVLFLMLRSWCPEDDPLGVIASIDGAIAAIHLIVTAKNGISSVELGRRLGVKQPTAWTVKHKIMAVMARREGETALTGRVEMDDAYLGGVRSGGKRGRGAAGKTPFVAAVSTSPEGRPRKLKLAPVKGFRKREIARGANPERRL